MIDQACIKCNGQLRWVRFNEGTEDYNSGLYVTLPQCIQCGKVYYEPEHAGKQVSTDAIS